jgi:hypothetical protein
MGVPRVVEDTGPIALKIHLPQIFNNHHRHTDHHFNSTHKNHHTHRYRMFSSQQRTAKDNASLGTAKTHAILTKLLHTFQCWKQ